MHEDLVFLLHFLDGAVGALLYFCTVRSWATAGLKHAAARIRMMVRNVERNILFLVGSCESIKSIALADEFQSVPVNFFRIL